MILGNLFAKNPFRPLKDHMAKTAACVEETKVLFDALFAQDKEGVKASAKRISQLEHDADVVKAEIRSRLTKSIFLPVDRRDVLTILSNMDAIADQAEDIGVLLTLRWMEPMPGPMQAAFQDFRARVYEVVEAAVQVIDAIDQLIEDGFSGKEAERVIGLVDEVGRLEHQADKAQDKFGKLLFAHEDDLKPAALFMWIKIANKVGDIANASERMCNQLRILLADA